MLGHLQELFQLEYSSFYVGGDNNKLIEIVIIETIL